MLQTSNLAACHPATFSHTNPSCHFRYLNCCQILYSNATDLKLGSSTYFFLLYSFLLFTKCQVLNLTVGPAKGLLSGGTWTYLPRPRWLMGVISPGDENRLWVRPSSLKSAIRLSTIQKTTASKCPYRDPCRHMWSSFDCPNMHDSLAFLLLLYSRFIFMQSSVNKK